MVKQITELLLVEVTDCLKLLGLEVLRDRFGCATVHEAVATQEIFAAALESQRSGSSVKIG